MIREVIGSQSATRPTTQTTSQRPKPYHWVECSCSVVREVRAVSHTWELRDGKVLVVEDAKTASLVVGARDLKDRDDKAAVLEEILRVLRT